MDIDYLIVGAGASGMAFLDVLLSETDATAAIVDRRPAPGGHWNDAYPFVRLHQASSFYGVPSRPLGQDRRIPAGLNAGLPEMAGKPEILHYYADLMEQHYLPTGRVTWLPMSEHLGDGVVRHRLSGAQTRINVGRRIVDAGFMGERASIPQTHTRNFDVAAGVTCVPPNDLPRLAPAHDRHTVLGAGKTAMDAVLWLLENGVDPDAISWVRPRDYWLFVRENVVPHADFFFPAMENTLAELESLAKARSVEEHCSAMEACGRWHRIDRDIWPTGFHAAVCSRPEVEALRRVGNVIRMGRALRLEPGRMTLAGGTVPVAGDPLYIDCTASGGALLEDSARPVFEPGRINLVMVRPFQPVFSAALIARIETEEATDLERNALARPVDFHETPVEFMAAQLTGMANQHMWGKHPAIRDWIDGCRLNAAHHLLAGLSPKDSAKMELLQRFGPLTRAAAENLPALVASAR